MVGKIDDLAQARGFDRRMWPFDKALQSFGEPMLAARLFMIAINPSLHDDQAPKS
jgi:hypothetical protein